MARRIIPYPATSRDPAAAVRLRDALEAHGVELPAAIIAAWSTAQVQAAWAFLALSERRTEVSFWKWMARYIVERGD